VPVAWRISVLLYSEQIALSGANGRLQIVRKFLRVLAECGVVLAAVAAGIAAIVAAASFASTVEGEAIGPSLGILFGSLGCLIFCGILFELTEVAGFLEYKVREPQSESRFESPTPVTPASAA
jgi:hypothetical protein